MFIHLLLHLEQEIKSNISKNEFCFLANLDTRCDEDLLDLLTDLDRSRDRDCSLSRMSGLRCPELLLRRLPLFET